MFALEQRYFTQVHFAHWLLHLCLCNKVALCAFRHLIIALLNCFVLLKGDVMFNTIIQFRSLILKGIETGTGYGVMKKVA